MVVPSPAARKAALSRGFSCDARPLRGASCATGRQAWAK